MKTDQFSKVEACALRINDELWLDTILFFRNSSLIYSCFDDWKDNDSFYFIPLKLNMTYSGPGWAVHMADTPISLGTFVRSSLAHPDLYSTQCPNCGKPLFPYGYNGSPLSGRVDLQYNCNCGWSDYVIASGWRVRSDILKATQHKDKLRQVKYRLLHRNSKPMKVADLLTYLSA